MHIFREIKPVNPKGNQLWIFIGRTDAEALILWLLDVKSRLIGKDPESGKDWRQEEKGPQRMRDWMASPTQRIWVWASSGRGWRTGKPGVLQSMGSQRVGYDLATEQCFQKRGTYLHLFIIEHRFVFTKHKNPFNQIDTYTNSYWYSSKYTGMQTLTPTLAESICSSWI